MQRVPAGPKGVVRVIKEARGTGGIASHEHLGSGRRERAHTHFEHDVRNARRLIDQKQQVLSMDPCRASGFSFEAVRLTANAPSGS